MEQTRLFVALALSLGLLFFYQEFVLRRQAGESPPVAVQTDQAPTTDGPASVQPGKARSERGNRGFRAGQVGQHVVVSTDRFVATFTTQGARLIDLELKGFKRDLHADSPSLDLVFPSPVLPLTMMLGGKGGDAKLVYSADRERVDVSGGSTAAVRFSWRSASGKRVLEKRFIFRGDSYRFDVVAAGRGTREKSPSGLLVTPLRPDGPMADPKLDNAVVLAKNKIVEHLTSSLLDQGVVEAGAQWVGFSNQYFLMALVAPEGASAEARVGTAGDWPTAKLVTQGKNEIAMSVFAGPKDHDVLVTAGSNLDRALDFGWFWFVAVPLLQVLHWLYAVTANYGVAIILLTALVRLVTVPLSQSSFKNMREMQKLQPQIERLRAKFKDDQMALQKETMELYRRHKVNPLSGCLPMVLQLPVFVGLYNALYHAIELRHAPFMLWINDLSSPDRLMVAGMGVPVLTIIMGGTMLVQQWLTPQQGDPSQRMVMMLMPVIFTYMFISFPAGLVLYWLVSNVLSIAQQYYVTRVAN